MPDTSVCPNCGNNKNPGPSKCPHCCWDPVEEQGANLWRKIDEKRTVAGLAEADPTQDYRMVQPISSEKTDPHAPSIVQEQNYYPQQVCNKCGTIIPPGSSMCRHHGRFGKVVTIQIPSNKDKMNDNESHEVLANRHEDIQGKISSMDTDNVFTAFPQSQSEVNQNQITKKQNRETSTGQRLVNNSTKTDDGGISFSHSEHDKLSMIDWLRQNESKKKTTTSSSLMKLLPLFVSLLLIVFIFIVVSTFGTRLSGLIDQKSDAIAVVPSKPQVYGEDALITKDTQSSNSPHPSNPSIVGMPPVIGNIAEIDKPPIGTNVVIENQTHISSPTTSSQTDITPLEITSGPFATFTNTSATIEWSTNELAKSRIKFGLNPGGEFPSIETISFSNYHHIFINGLAPNTKYYYQLISKDANSKVLVGNIDYSFTTKVTTNEAPNEGSQAPEFKLRTLDHGEVSLSQYRGKKVILNFWADWCSACKIEMPHLQIIKDNFKNSGVVVLTVASSDSNRNELSRIVKDSSYTFDVALDTSDHVSNIYNIISLPRTFFIDKDGVIRKFHRGMFTSPGEIEFMINSY